MIDYGLIIAKYSNEIFSITQGARDKHLVFKFNNKYGASLRNNNYSKDSELAVIKFNVERFEYCDCVWDVTFETSITDSVIKDIKSSKKLIKILEEIKFLKEEI